MDVECNEKLEMANGRKTATQCERKYKKLKKIFQVGDGNTGDLPRIIEMDIFTCVGVIHIVNQVILPSDGEATAVPSSHQTGDATGDATSSLTSDGSVLVTSEATIVPTYNLTNTLSVASSVTGTWLIWNLLKHPWFLLRYHLRRQQWQPYYHSDHLSASHFGLSAMQYLCGNEHITGICFSNHNSYSRRR